jgi:hypothetical protein
VSAGGFIGLRHTFPDSSLGIEVILRFDWIPLGAQARRPYAFSLSPLVLAFLVYGRPETVPSISPVSVIDLRVVPKRSNEVDHFHKEYKG